MKTPNQIRDHKDAVKTVWATVGIHVADAVYYNTTLPTRCHTLAEFRECVSDRVAAHDDDKAAIVLADEASLDHPPMFNFEYLAHDLRADHHATHWVVADSLTREAFTEHLIDHMAVNYQAAAATVSQWMTGRTSETVTCGLVDMDFLMTAGAFYAKRALVPGRGHVTDIERVLKSVRGLSDRVAHVSRYYVSQVKKIRTALDPYTTPIAAIDPHVATIGHLFTKLVEIQTYNPNKETI